MKPDKKIIATRTRIPSHRGGHRRRPPEDPRGVDALIDGTEGFRAAGSFRSMEEALAGIGQVLPDAALLDIVLPGTSGIEGVRALKERYSFLLFLDLSEATF